MEWSKPGPDPNLALHQPPPAPESERIVAFLSHIRAVLVPGEEIQAWAIQRRLFALLSRRTIVVATSGRLLFFMRRWIAGYEMRDARWQDLSSTKIRSGLFGADLTVGVLDGGDLASGERSATEHQVRGLRPAQAESVYRICQAHDQAWREKRRIRDLEEMRARAGGVQIGAGNQGQGFGAQSSAEDPTLRLQRARDMLGKGLITDAEYEAIKAKIISGL